MQDNINTVYSLKKQEMANCTPLKATEIDRKLANVGAWFSSNMKVNYYMLLNRDIHYYTVFNFLSQNFYKGTQELGEVLSTRGYILEIEYNHDFGYYEIWIKHFGEEDPSLYLFFPCNDFVIEI